MSPLRWSDLPADGPQEGGHLAGDRGHDDRQPGASFHDMALYLIARHVGLKEARQVARTYLLDWRDDGQRPFASLLVAKQVEDALIRRCQQ